MIYTKDNPKFTYFYECIFKDEKNFTGVVKDSYGDIAYFLNGKLHREDGPAVECYNGSKHWYINGKRHREDGPAVIHLDGKQWWLNGENLAVSYNHGLKFWVYTNLPFEEESWIRFVKLQFFK